MIPEIAELIKQIEDLGFTCKYSNINYDDGPILMICGNRDMTGIDWGKVGALLEANKEAIREKEPCFGFLYLW